MGRGEGWGVVGAVAQCFASRTMAKTTVIWDYGLVLMGKGSAVVATGKND